MTRPTLYPPADHKSQWFYDPNQGIEMPMDHVKWVQHTTESAGGWPTYSDGLICPTLTYEPWLHQWRQHLPINHSARALVNDGGNYTNRCDVVQVEISCYCDPALAKKGGHFVEALDQEAISDLAAFAVWMHQEWGMALDFQPSTINWPRYNGQQPFDRMTWADYAAFSGVLGHISVPGNVHLDPGSLDNVSIKAVAEQMLGGKGQGGDPPVKHQTVLDAQHDVAAARNLLVQAVKDNPDNKRLAELIQPAIDTLAEAYHELYPINN